MTHFGGPFWTPFLTPFELSWPKPRGQPHMGVPIPSEGVQKGVQKGVKNRPKTAVFGWFWTCF